MSDQVYSTAAKHPSSLSVDRKGTAARPPPSPLGQPPMNQDSKDELRDYNIPKFTPAAKTFESKQTDQRKS